MLALGMKRTIFESVGGLVNLWADISMADGKEYAANKYKRSESDVAGKRSN